MPLSGNGDIEPAAARLDAASPAISNKRLLPAETCVCSRERRHVTSSAARRAGC